MVVSISPSTVTVPRDNPGGFVFIIDFLDARFPLIGRREWEKRINNNLVENLISGKDKTPVTISSPLVPGARVLYYREVETEPVIPFREKILFQNDHLIVVCKPHFLPVVPSGIHVNETLLNRLKILTGNQDLVPINRIDRETAGLVLFSVQPETRGAFQRLFMEKKVKKVYEAITLTSVRTDAVSGLTQNRIANRIVRGDPWFRNRIVPGTPNAETRLELIRNEGKRAFFRLFPKTGKKHQLRIHLASIGCPIENDRYYPDLLPKQKG